MSTFKPYCLRLIATLILALSVMAAPAHAVYPSYVYANNVCPASAPWLIGYARFTNAPVCSKTCNMASLGCYDFGGRFYPSQANKQRSNSGRR